MHGMLSPVPECKLRRIDEMVTRAQQLHAPGMWDVQEMKDLLGHLDSLRKEYPEPVSRAFSTIRMSWLAPLIQKYRNVIPIDVGRKRDYPCTIRLDQLFAARAPVKRRSPASKRAIVCPDPMEHRPEQNPANP